jgi:hypothetical protein
MENPSNSRMSELVLTRQSKESQNKFQLAISVAILV